MAKEPSFKVIDRRHFNPDGSKRQADGEDASADRPAAAQSAPVTPAAESAPAAPAAPAVKKQPASARREEPDEPAGDLIPATRPEFKALVQYLGEQALLAISGQLNLPMGQVMEIVETNIAFLEVLGEKTRSNLSPDEEQWLRDILRQLRYSFLELKKAKGTRH
jgi:hypothetical protein